MTNSKELSEKYCGDNMYQLLARQAISRLSGYFIANSVSAEKIQTEILSIYDGLIDFYRQQSMTDARLLLMLDKLHYKGNDVSRGGVNERLRLTDEQVITLLNNGRKNLLIPRFAEKCTASWQNAMIECRITPQN